MKDIQKDPKNIFAEGDLTETTILVKHSSLQEFTYKLHQELPP